jgi:uncharacterized protein
MKFLIHITQGPENPTKAALAFLVAKTAVEKGHEVNLFLAGDAVQLMRRSVLENLQGLGTGSLMEHFKVLESAGCRFYLSGMSSKARGLTLDEFAGMQIEFAMPPVLIDLAIESDKMFVY